MFGYMLKNENEDNQQSENASENHQDHLQQQQKQQQRKQPKPSNFQPLQNNRRRMSSGAQQRRGGGGINMRDPLGLESVQPEQPENGENKKEAVVSAGVDDQQQKGINIKRLTTTTTPTNQRYTSPVSRKSLGSIKKNLRGENKEIGEEKDKLVDFNDSSNGSSVQLEEEKKKKQQKMAESNQQSISSFDFSDDPRVSFFCPDWFFEKSILDLGCNAGRFAITLARRCQPKKVIGIDLDQHLIGAARKNIRHFADKEAKLTSRFPASFPANFGPISAPSTSSGSKFPDNIWFFCQNYVLNSDDELEKVTEEFEIIFALSLTKWIHLNWGDVGIRRFFHRAFRQLKTGGRFVLETAPYKDYIKHCNKKGSEKPPEEVLNNLSKIAFHPEEFTEYLLNNVGFNHHEELNTPQSKYLGISGRLQVFYKGKFMLTPRRGCETDLIIQHQQQEKQQQQTSNGTTMSTTPKNM
uniref:RNA methyltransferase n=1 Tax=Meloidogyne enterolobii TaxID=390850 RepID=A0A6V7TT73_MELEN|nr:unnamed protein product [Meloidogyne enterolobii]